MAPRDPALTSFVGRTQELQKLGNLLDGFRLVVVLGPGGIGKTRVVRRLLEERAGNSVFVDLADARDLGAMNRALALSLGLPPESADEVSDLLPGCGDLLVVLDNFEQLVDLAASEVHDWLQSAPGLRVLVTSRRRLDLGGEVSFELPPLSQKSESLDSEALSLFIERARRSRPNADWESDDLRGTANEIVRRLDGIPLALELAAGQLRLMEPAELLERLDGLLQALGKGPRNAAERHRTVRCAVQGSWDALTLALQLALARCSVFRGGFTLDAAEAVLADLGDVMELVSELRDRSLLRSSAAAGTTRLGLYETVRAFAEEQLSSDERGAALSALARWCAAQPLVSGRLMSRRRIQQAAAERDNLVTAFEWGAEVGHETTASVGIRLAAVYTLRGPAASALSVMTRTIDVAKSSGFEGETLADLHCRRGRLQVQYGELSAALADCEAAGRTPQVSAGLSGEIAALRAGIERSRGDAAAAENAYREALELLRKHRPKQAGRTLSNFAGFLIEQGRIPEGREAFAEALRALQAAGDLRLEAVTLGNLGLVEHEEGQFESARSHFERALKLHLELGYRRFVGITRGDLAVLSLEEGKFAAADELFDDACEDLRAAGDFRQLALVASAHSACLARIGRFAAARERAQESESLSGRLSGTALAEVVAVYGLHRELAAGPDQSELRALVQERLGSEVEANDELRLALRILRAALEEFDLGTLALQVSHGSEHLTLPGGDGISLASRPVLARLFDSLAAASLSKAGPVSVEELIRTGWPEQRSANAAAVNRLHVALSTLRKMGLKPFIVRTGDAYQLSDDLRVVRTTTVDHN